MTKSRVVFDTNIYISAIIFSGVCRKILLSARHKKITLYISSPILLEVARTLQKKFFWDNEKIKKTIKQISRLARITKPRLKVNLVKKDPADNKIIECAKEAKAQFIVSGDDHLLKIKKYQKIKIISPRQFLENL